MRHVTYAAYANMNPQKTTSSTRRRAATARGRHRIRLVRRFLASHVLGVNIFLGLYIAISHSISQASRQRAKRHFKIQFARNRTPI